MGEFQGRRSGHGEDATTAATVSAGKRSLVAARYPALSSAMAQRAGDGAEPTIHDAATIAVENKDGGSAVDGGVASRVGAHLGADFSGVRVHQDPLAQEATAAMGARAFAYGSDVFLGPGESGSDLGLMAHELTHVAQQGAAGQRAPQRAVQVGEANSPAEAEADQVSAAVTGGTRPARLLVDAGPVAPGQMLKSQFLDQLRTQVVAATQPLLGPEYAGIGSPVDQLLGRYAGMPAAALEAQVRRTAPSAAGVSSASEMIPPVVARMRAGVETWKQTGQMPAELTAADPAAAGAAGSAQAQALRAPDGRETLASLEAELGPGTPLDSGIASRMSSALGVDVSSARIHTGAVAARKADEAGALAFAVGDHIVMSASAPGAGTLAGDALLAHELTHVAQQSGAASDPVARRQPIGGESAAAEDHADAAAVGAMAQLHGGKGLAARLSSGLKTGLQLQRCPGKDKEGKISHQGTAGAGQVTARENDLTPKDNTNTAFSLEYAGKDADKAHWLQFVNFSMYADESGKQVYFTGSVGTTSGNKPFSTDKVTNWSVDSASTSDPYYEAAGVNTREPNKNTKIFDRPGGASIAPLAAQLVTTKAPKATQVTFIAGFDTYLVLDGKAIYHVTWTATTLYDPAKKTTTAIGYGTGNGGAVAGLPKDLKTVLDTQYSGNTIN